MAQIEERVSDLEKLMQQLTLNVKQVSENIDKTQRELSARIDQVTKTIDRLQEEMKEFKKDMNKRWGDVANRLGTLAEDLIAPNLPGLVKKEFGFDEPCFLGLRLKKRSKEHNIHGEVDCLLKYDDHVFVCEVKSQSSNL